MKDADIHAMFEILSADKPEPKTELEFSNPFTLLIAVLLSAQATDVGVNKATKALFERADSAAKMAELSLDEIKESVKTIGLFNTKANNIFKLTRILLEQHGGRVPNDRESLEALPGVGRKTANVVMNEVFGIPTIAVDTHIFRVSNRTGLGPAKTPDKVEALLMERVPTQFKKGAHHWLILHGRYVCKARKPECGQCKIAEYCQYEGKIKIK